MSNNIDLLLLKRLRLFSDDIIKNLPQRIKRSLKEIAPDKIFIFNEKPLILYFKTTDKLTIDDIFKKYWNFSEVPIIFIENCDTIDIYNGFDYILQDGKPTPLKLKSDELNYYSLISGEYFQNSSFKKPKNKIDTVLLQNITDARKKLISLSQGDAKKVTSIANALLGRIIFIRYLIDRKIALYYDGKKQTITNDDLKEILSSKERTYQLFKDLQSPDKGFNGNWFPIDESENEIIKQEHLNVLKELISGTQIATGQRSLFDYYDFSIIPIEFISNVYENFIGEEEQKKSGAYYTPTFLVDYVLKHTIDKFFEENPNTYNCKVLDPACGSGIFLVETFRKLVAQYEKIKGKKADKETLKKIATDNIFGIDYNSDALQISIFSLYLTMLDYQEPKDLVDFKFPRLDNNFFENDFFDTKAKFNDILKEKKIDFIIGNPPYGRGNIKKGSFVDKYVKENDIDISGKEIVQPFMVRVKDFKYAKVAFIVTSKVFYNLNAKKFRKDFLNHFKISHILELSSVRKEIFKNADTPVSIIFYQKATEEEIKNNTINYISMKPNPYFKKTKFLLLTKFKRVSQSKLIEYDYLWKILVYGSYLDFNFIKRLKQRKKITDYILSQAQGITIGGKDKNPTNQYDGMKYIETSDIEYFYIKKSNKQWKAKNVHRNKNLELFKAPSLLVSKGLNKNTLQLKVGLLICDAIFTDSITALKSKNIEILYTIEGLLYSKIFKYYILQIASSIGIEREQLHNLEKFSMPYVESEKIINVVKEIENLQKEYFDTNGSNIFHYEQQFKRLTKELDEAVLEAFNLTEQEKSLVDYTTNIVIPWVIQKDYKVAFSHYEYQDRRIEEYVNIFMQHYSKMYEENNLFFQATIYWSKYAIGVYFKILKEKHNSHIVWKKEENIENFLKLMQGKTLENLFIQKDIKGFEKDGFYVIKPNEIKNWHKAIGYLDYYEFEDAILRAGK